VCSVWSRSNLMPVRSGRLRAMLWLAWVTEGPSVQETRHFPRPSERTSMVAWQL